jgi:hypothetical protein
MEGLQAIEHFGKLLLRGAALPSLAARTIPLEVVELLEVF